MFHRALAHWIGLILIGLIIVPVAASAAGQAPGLVASYSFEEGPGGPVKDWSGHGNDGKIVGDVSYVKLDKAKGYAIRFNTGNAYVDCGNGPSLDMRKAVTIELWLRPEGEIIRGEAGVAGKLMGSYCLSYSGVCYFYCPGGGNYASTSPVGGAWHHIIATFDGSEIRMYVDGNLANFAKSSVAELPAGGNFYLRYPATYETVEPEFRCMLDNVRVYNRALTDAEAVRHYREEARATGHHDATWFDRVKLTLLPFSQSGSLVVQGDVSQMDLPKGRAVVKLEIVNAAGKVALRRDLVPAALDVDDKSPIRFEFQDRGQKGVGYSTLNVRSLRPGRYTLRATAVQAGKRIGQPSTAAVNLPLRKPEWVKAYDGVKPLNNMVAELLSVKSKQSEQSKTYRFKNPRDGWIFIASGPATLSGSRRVSGAAASGRVLIFIDKETEPAIVHDKDTKKREAMRHLPAGPHTLTVKCEGSARPERLIVRSMPEMMVADLGYHALPLLKCFGHYNAEYLDRIGMLGSINTLIERNPLPEDEPYVREWRRQGKRLLTHYSQWEMWQKRPTTADEVFNMWTGERGLKGPGYDGVIADEFSGSGHGGSGSYPLYAEAVRRITGDARFDGRVFYPYCMPMYPSDSSMDLIRALTEGGHKWAEEKYLTEQPNEKAAVEHMGLRLRENLLRYEALVPGAARHMITTLGFMSAPPETLNVNPSADFKVYMDMQMHLLATDPVFFGLYGIQWYHNGYVDEEDLRWAAKLFRHYGIEGRTDRLTKDPYDLTHLRNPDFDEGLVGWTLNPAEEGSITLGHAEGYGILQTRSASGKSGDSFLMTRRGAKSPNRFTQPIRGLTPGRLYSVKMLTADYDELLAGKSEQNPHVVRIDIDGAEVLPGREFHQLFPSGMAGHTYGPFVDGNHLYETYHRVIFRASSPKATLTVSDWQTDAAPGGPIGQRMMFNFFELQPYFE